MTKDEVILMSKRVGPLTQGHRPCNLFLIHKSGQIQYIVVDSTWHGKDRLYDTEDEIFEEFGNFLENKRLVKYDMEYGIITVIEGGKVVYHDYFETKNKG